MNCPKPIFSVSDSSVISIVRGLHSYFRNLQSYYKVLQGQIISELEYTNHPEEIDELKKKLKEVNRRIRYIHVLNNSASTVDEVINLEEIRDEFSLNLEKSLEV